LDGDAWSRDGVLAAIGEGETRRVDLAEPVAVHLIYRTAWVDEDGTVQFRRDVYGRDARLAAAW
jgi:murein L,D-transpeptidase YcbB/YkuD